MLIALSCVLLENTGIAAHNFEESRFFNYANLSYLFVVMLGFGAVAVGGFSLIWLSHLAEKAMLEARLQTETATESSKSKQNTAQ